MLAKPSSLSMLLQPSIRSLAYICAFKDLGIFPKEIILMQGDIGKLQEVRVEDEKFGYSEQFFDLTIDLLKYVKECGAKITKVSLGDINDNEIIEAVKNCSSKDIVFTGGGILREEILASGKNFLHVHPGIVPEFKGSTCFYYSIIEKGTVGSTAFFMDEHLDTGQIIASSEFIVNLRILPEQTLFMDYILDPYIRAYTLKKVLKSFVASNSVIGRPQISSDKSAYYIMHPLLRHIAVNKLNNMYDGSSEDGIFEITGG